MIPVEILESVKCKLIFIPHRLQGLWEALMDLCQLALEIALFSLTALQLSLQHSDHNDPTPYAPTLVVVKDVSSDLIR